MPPKRAAKSDDGDERRVGTLVKRVRASRRDDFASSAVHREFEAHVTAAQSHFLQGDATAAEREATLALRIHPTAHLFALLAVIAESRGRFDRASDFRLLQAFLARDMVLWEELLHEFMSKELYYKSVVCLQRMSALEKDKTRYRALQLQLADLLVGLGEVRRASNVLVPLWNSSRCRDFEVFALLSSLYFQLGKWASLQRLIESSVKHAFQLPPSASPTGAEGGEAGGHAEQARSADAAQREEGGAEGESSSSTARVSKRVRFFGLEDSVNEESAAQSLRDAVASSIPPPPSLTESPAALDEFSFDELASPGSPTPPPLLSQVGGGGGGSGASAASSGGAIHQLYGERIALTTEQSKKNFLTLVNVHAELLIEQGSFTETVQLLHMAAGCLDGDVMELPPDLLVRLGVAYAFLGGVWEQPCRDVFQHLVEHCSMEDYGDVLLDAAVSLQKVGMHADAAQLYTCLSRYHRFVYDRLHRQVGVADVELGLLQDTAAVEQVRAATEQLDALRAEEGDVRTVLAAALLGEAQCAYAQGAYAEARERAEQVLELDATHLQARLLLGRYFYYQCADTEAAVAVLTPKDGEPALQRIQLGAFLVQVFQSARRYVEAIALGVSIFEVLLSSEEDGDTQSVAPGTSSRRSSSALYLPTMTRASSAIIPASSLAGMVRAGGGSTATARTSFSLAASIRASSSVARQQLSRRGLESLTTTVYGASAAASVAAGWDKKEAEEQQKDASTIFRFNRRRKTPAKDAAAPPGDAPTLEEGKEEGSSAVSPGLPKTAEERRDAVMKMAPSDFWTAQDGDGDESKGASSEAAAKKPKVEPTATEETMAPVVKVEPKAEDDEEGPSVQHGAPVVGAKRGRGKGEDKSTPAPGEAVAKAPRKKRKTREDTANEGRARPSNYTTVQEREQDLAELEDFLTQAETLASAPAAGEATEAPHPAGSGESGSTPDDAGDASAVFELPSLEEVSKQFSDPTMAQLFLEASSFAPGGGVRGAEGKEGDGSDPWEALAEANGAAVPGPLPGDDKVTLREAMEALGKVGFIALAVAVVECYSAVGNFTEAREFAFVALTRFQQKQRLRQLGHRLERPLRLAVLRAALAAGESEDAYRVGLRLLQEDSAEEKRNEVMELMHSVLNRCEDRSSILYRAVADGYNDPGLLVLLANRYYQTRSYTRVLNLYLMALQERRNDIFLNFMVGLAYLFCSHQKRTLLREACVSAAIYYLTRYQQLRLSLEPSAAAGEVIYNVARALQFLKLYYLCIPLYERVAYDLCAPSECSVALQRAARFNLYFLYRWGSGNRTLALSALQPRRSGSDSGASSVTRVPSPFA